MAACVIDKKPNRTRQFALPKKSGCTFATTDTINSTGRVYTGNKRETAASGLAAAKRTMESINEALREGAARLAAQQAARQLTEAIAASMKQVDESNKDMHTWQKHLGEPLKTNVF